MKTIGLCLFGYNKNYDQSMSFEKYLSYFTISIRAYKSLYIGWDIYLAVDSDSYSKFRELFDYFLYEKIIDKLDVFDPSSIGKSTLWRFNPIKWSDYMISRDVDSLPTYRERQCVEIWLNKDTLAHSINDNPVHSLSLLAGLVGFKKNSFNLDKLNELNIDYTLKGGDQDFLNIYVYPLVKDSIVEHRIKGMPIRPENPYSYNNIEDIDVDVRLNLKEGEDKKEVLLRTNKLINHMGQAGIRIFNHVDLATGNFFEGAICFWSKYGDQKIHEKLLYIEKKYPNIFWTKNDIKNLCQK